MVSMRRLVDPTRTISMWKRAISKSGRRLICSRKRHLTDLWKMCHNYGMAVRTTVDIPEPLHDVIRQRAHQSGTSMRLLIVRSLEQSYGKTGKTGFVTESPIKAKGKRGPRFPTDETPHDLIYT